MFFLEWLAHGRFPIDDSLYIDFVSRGTRCLCYMFRNGGFSYRIGVMSLPKGVDAMIPFGESAGFGTNFFSTRVLWARVRGLGLG